MQNELKIYRFVDLIHYKTRLRLLERTIIYLETRTDNKVPIRIQKSEILNTILLSLGNGVQKEK